MTKGEGERESESRERIHDLAEGEKSQSFNPREWES